MKREHDADGTPATTKRVKTEPGVASSPAANGNGRVKAESGTVKTEHTSVKREQKQRIVCPYLDTINRNVLDFDFEKICSVSLSKINVYACLICGKYYQGKGKNTHAYTHALEANHHVFVNLHTERLYCLPDDYEIFDASLQDIQYNLHPVFNKQLVAKLDTNTSWVHALDGSDYLPGTIGLNNIKNTDWLNSSVQMLAAIPALRHYFLAEDNWKNTKSVLVHRFAELIGKMWNNRAFKSHVSPHELLQAIADASEKKFRIGQQSDPLQFLSWFLNTLHRDLGGTKKKGSSIIHECLQGEIKVEHEQKVKKESKSQAGRKGKGKGKGKAADDRYETKITHTKTSFLYISLDLPAAPLFQDAKDRTMIPQIPLFELLSKFDGQTEAIQPDGSIKRYSIVKLPRYLMLHAKRFQHNNWFVEKNPTLVTFPLKNLDMRFFKAKRSRPSLEKLGSFPVPALKKLIKKYRLTAPAQVVEKRELVEVLDRFYEGAGESKEVTKYDLIANLCHEGKPGKGAYKVHIHQRSCNTWYEMQDLHVWSTETMPQLVALSETYIQVYELHQK